MIQPLGSRVLIEPIKVAELMSAGGIMLGEEIAPQSIRAKVVAVGPDATTVEVGDVVYVSQFSPTECRDIPSDKTLICPEEDILAKANDTTK